MREEYGTDVPRRASARVSRRTQRIGSMIRALIADAIQRELNDPRVPTITSITQVDVSADLALARVRVSVMGADTERRLCIEALESAAGHLRWLLGRELTLRKIPELRFELDESVRGSFETIQAIDRVMDELESRGEGDREREAEPPHEDCGLAEDA